MLPILPRVLLRAVAQEGSKELKMWPFRASAKAVVPGTDIPVYLGGWGAGGHREA